jgi:hypothetical protein
MCCRKRFHKTTQRDALKTLNNGGNTHAAANTQGRQTLTLILTFQLTEQGAEDHCARRA